MSRPHRELILLGLLDERHVRGYELRELLEHRLHFVTDLEKPTAYRLLERLYQRGLVERSAERQGQRHGPSDLATGQPSGRPAPESQPRGAAGS